MSPQKASKPRVILGLFTFGPDVNLGARITSLDDFDKCLNYFQSRGYDEVDTARMYLSGKQEETTGALDWRKRGLTLATKVYPTQPGWHGAQMLQQKLSESLSALQSDSVDIFYLHAADRSVPFLDTLKTLDALHKEGKFRQLGLSNFSAFEVAEVVTLCINHGLVRPTIYQAMYNAITRSIEPELIPCCRRYGIDVVVYNPLAGGILSGKYLSSSEKPTEGRFSDTGPLGPSYRQRYFKDSNFKALNTIDNAAKKYDLTLVETAMRWLCHHSALNIKDGGHDGIIIGVSSFAQLKGNLDDLEKGPLPDEVVQALDDAWMIVKPTAPNYWHGDLKYTYNTEDVLFGSKSS